MTPDHDGPDAPRKVLAVCDLTEADEALLRAAAALADRRGAPLGVLLPVEPPSDCAAVARATGLTAAQVADRLARERRGELADHVARLLPGRAADCAVRVGKPFVEIVRHVLADPAGLLVKTAEPFGRAGSLPLGSTDQHLLRKCPCPVWLRRPGTPDLPQRILAAVDVDDPATGEPGAQDALNRRVLDCALGIAAGPEAEVTALHAWDAPGEGLVRLWASGPDADRIAVDYVRQIEAARWRALERLVAACPDRPRPVPRLVRGPARRVIPDQARGLGAQTLVLGTVARTGLGGIIIGNTAEDILNSVDCSILATKPPGFVSPLATP